MSEERLKKQHGLQKHGARYDGKKRPCWQKPEILSVEPLEAAAAICEPANAPFGKDFPGSCGTLGS